MLLILMVVHTYQEVTCRLEAIPTGRHAGSDFQEVRNEAFVETEEALLAYNGRDCTPDRAVLITHSRHRVDLEAATKHVTI